MQMILPFRERLTVSPKNSETNEGISSLLIVNDHVENRKNDLILIMTPEKQDKTLELSKH